MVEKRAKARKKSGKWRRKRKIESEQVKCMQREGGIKEKWSMESKYSVREFEKKKFHFIKERKIWVLDQNLEQSIRLNHWHIHIYRRIIRNRCSQVAWFLAA